MNPLYIKVGISTCGDPELTAEGDVAVLHNQRIGISFHWEKKVESRLPGSIVYSSDPEFQIVNILPLETYLECVVGSEMNPSAPAEFLKAHAIISRSWALGKILKNHHCSEIGKIDTPEEIVNWEDTCDHQGFDVCADDHCQRYQGLQPVPESTLRAIRSTEGIVLIDNNGMPIDARFSKCCGGVTERFSSCWQNEERPALKSIFDPWCDLSALSVSDRHALLSSILKDYDMVSNGGFNWQAEVTKEEIKSNLLTKFHRNIGNIIAIRPRSVGASGRIVSLDILGSNGRLSVGKELMIRRLLSPTHLYSSNFEIKERGDSFILVGKGWGHGVGLCQIGAAHMAYAGHSCEEILSFYYPGAKISPLSKRNK